MPGLDSKMHLNMLQGALRRGQPEHDGLYGLQWGNPDDPGRLQHVRDHWLLRFVDPDKVALEIGPGGGRWTRYMLPFKTLYAVDYHPELLAELRKNFPQPNIVEIANSGTDFPGVPAGSVDFVFSFGTFVHLDLPIIRAYLDSLRSVLHPHGQAVIQYADKDKPMALGNPGFAANNPRIMRAAIEAAGFNILEEDTQILPHSSIVRLEHDARLRPARKDAEATIAMELASIAEQVRAQANASQPAPRGKGTPPAHGRLPPTPECEPLRYPDFLCIGAQKSATTWLDRNLRDHSGVWLPPIKELGYFSEWHCPASRTWIHRLRHRRGVEALERYLSRTQPEARNYRQIARLADIIGTASSDHWYGRIFSLASGGQICGEVCPEYALLPREGIEHVLRLSPDVRIVMLLRDPIDRTWSQVRKHLGVRNLDPAAEARNPAVLERGDYPAIIRRWLEFIPQERMFVTFLDLDQDRAGHGAGEPMRVPADRASARTLRQGLGARLCRPGVRDVRRYLRLPQEPIPSGV